MTIYEVYINNKQFTCIFTDDKNEKEIPITLGFSNLIFVKKESIDGNIKIYYQLNEIINIKIYLNEKFLFEKFFPLIIPLNRLRDLLSLKINEKFNFSYNHNIIQCQEESSFCLKNIIQKDAIYLYHNEFMFINISNINEIKDDIPYSEKTKININNLKKNNESKQINDEQQKCDINEPNDSMKKKEKKNFKTENIKNEPLSEIVTEKEYEIYNSKSYLFKIKINQEMFLNDLREKILDLIPKRTLFIMNDKTVDASMEDKIKVKDIANQNIINLEFPKENKKETMEIQIFLNGNYYIKKDYYLCIKLKNFKINLKLDKNYKFIYKGEILPIEEENKMTLDDLCYKELKVFIIKTQEENNSQILKNNYKNKHVHLDKKILINNFKKNDIFDTWILIGKEKSGKTRFINCLANHLLGVKFEDNFRYVIEGQKNNGYEIYDIKRNETSQNIRILEFPGFSGEIGIDKTIKENIIKTIKKLDEIKLICFVISGNETRLTRDLKNIFSNVWNIFASDLRNNFIFIITNCDAKKPPVIDCIKDCNFSKIFSKQLESLFFKFNNSYLFDVNQKDLWDIGIYHYNLFFKSLGQKTNISLNLTKYLLNFDFEKSSINFIDSLKKLITYNQYYNILENIHSYDNKTNIDIPFDYILKEQSCSKCTKKITNIPCPFCSNTIYIEQKKPKNKISLQQLKMNNTLYSDCFNRYRNHIKEQTIHSAILYKNIKEFHNLKFFNDNSLVKDLEEMLDKNNKEKKEILKEINIQEDLYNKYLKGNNNMDYKNYLTTILYNE